MTKNVIKTVILLSAVLLAMLCITSCNKKSPSAPSDLNADFWELTWTGAPNATEYAVKISGNEYRTKETSFSLFDYVFPEETKTIRVKAIFGDESNSSEWVQIEYTAESVTDGLEYRLLSDGTYSVWCPADKIPKNGELVLPDYYEDLPVVIFKSERSPLMSETTLLTWATESGYKGPSFAGISKVRLPASLGAIDGGALYDSSIESIHIPSSVTYIANSAFEGCEALEKIDLPDGLTTIGNFAFAGCSSLKSITLPETLTTIGGGTFIGTSITSIDIPKDVKLLPYTTFYNCTSLSEINFSYSLEEILPGAFHNTAWYNSQPDGITVINSVLYNYKGDMPENTSLVVPESVKKLAGRNLFKGQKNLVSITLSEGIKRIPEAAFADCENLREVILPESLEAIEQSAFSGCGIENITLGSNVMSIGAGAFENCTSLTSINIPESVEDIAFRCFYGCTNLRDIIIEEGIRKIGNDVFLYCSSLTSLTIPDSVTHFNLNSIGYTGITHFVWPKNLNKALLYTPKYADGIHLTYLVIQKGTRLVDYNQLYAYDKLNTFFFEGTEDEYKDVPKDKDVDVGGMYTQENLEYLQSLIYKWESNLTVYYYSEEEPTESGNFWHYVHGVPTVW